ncbi:hypothetical protein [Desulfovibrio cuneatus]|uniref:hypothetical protein n=1 Tax=Desulfovibrio cuneatus TaxID=159728 RepID=UPI0012EB0FBD|nr:hypothetical protein [Desulfovibrio cuneatus]
MLDQQKIPMGRVRQAYGLSVNEVESVIHALWPHAVFPVELWRRTHEQYWRGFADSNQAVYQIDSPALPEVDTAKQFFHVHLCALDVMEFFRKLSLNIQSGPLQQGLQYILDESYEDNATLFQEEREFLFKTLVRLETVDPIEQYSPSSELFEDKILSLPPSSYHFISHIFADTVLVDTVAVIRLLRNYPLREEVKGITHALVTLVLKTFPEELPGTPFSVEQSSIQAPASPSTGSRKDHERIQATRQACEEVVKELYREKQVFDDNRAQWRQGLLFDNGKTNWKGFIGAVEKRLGLKPHHDTAREAWTKVPENLKHNGRMREQ